LNLRGRKWQEAGEDCKVSHNLYTSPNIIRVIKSRTMRGRHVACMEKMKKEYNISMRKPKGKRS
jgi:hypothetical protein